MEAILLQMSEQTNEGQRHLDYQHDIREMRRQMDKLSGTIGELVTAFKGNDLGTDGIVATVARLEAEQEKLNDRLDKMEMATGKKQMYLAAVLVMAGAIIGAILKSVGTVLINKLKN